MSFLVRALGSAAAPLLGRAGSWLAASAAPIAGRAASALGNLFGNSKLGQSALSYLVNQGLTTGFDYVKRFANSDYLRKKLPIMAPHLSNAADVLRDRLSEGYGNMMGSGGGGGDQQMKAQGGNMAGGIEKSKMMMG